MSHPRAALLSCCIGISVPAGALAGPDRLFALAPVLDRIAAHDVPLFVHPGRAPGQAADVVALDEPAWWRPLTDYVSQMQAAWYSFAAFGRSEHPDLKVVFAMLAGGAPLHHERLQARGCGPIQLGDLNTFYETSSYGPDAIQTMVGLVGESQLVYGTDRPVIEPRATGRDRALQANGANLIAKVHV
jgi:predicted TIM-barrel fold metal-dependent hydrolase